MRRITACNEHTGFASISTLRSRYLSHIVVSKSCKALVQLKKFSIVVVCVLDIASFKRALKLWGLWPSCRPVYLAPVFRLRYGHMAGIEQMKGHARQVVCRI